jgi:hypothetical protein
MAWNPDPKVAAAREFGKKFGKDVVIILSLNTTQGTVEFRQAKEDNGGESLKKNQFFQKNSTFI